MVLGIKLDLYVGAGNELWLLPNTIRNKSTENYHVSKYESENCKTSRGNRRGVEIFQTLRVGKDFLESIQKTFNFKENDTFDFMKR